MSYVRPFFAAILLSLSLPFHGLGAENPVAGLVSSAGDFAKGVGRMAGFGIPREQTEKDATIALEQLAKESKLAAKISKKAMAVLVFPKIIKAGLGIGGHYGEGVLRVKGKTEGFYNTAAASYGLQIGGQAFGYAMFFMDQKGLDYLLKSNDGWEVGVGPSVVLLDEGMAKTMNNTTLNESVYVFTFDQHGLMAGAGIQGSKITRMEP